MGVIQNKAILSEKRRPGTGSSPKTAGSQSVKRQSRRCHNDRVVESSRNGTMSAINGTISFIRQFVLYNRPPDAPSITRHATRQFAGAEAGPLPTNQRLGEPFIRRCCQGGHGNKI